MKITAIKQQIKQSNRYSIYIDHKYSFSLGEGSLLEAKLARGQELTLSQLNDYKKVSAEDKLYQLALRYVAMRPRTQAELISYLQRKLSPAPLIEQITNRLIELGLLNDRDYAKAYVHDRRLLRPASRRKIIMELRKKQIADEIIEAVVGHEPSTEQSAIMAIIQKKRKQSQYQNDLKLMQYLSRQGFAYHDIKAALQTESEA